MSMTIGKEARELAEAARQLHNIANHYSANGEWFTEDEERFDALARVEAALADFDRCTDANEREHEPVLPYGFPWDDRTRKDVAMAIDLLGGVAGAKGELDMASAMFHLARWVGSKNDAGC